jgi:DNA-binding HxlR family transcriptional regulator
MPRVAKPKPDYRSTCPISSALDLLGDRWTLLVVRDLFFAGARRFGDFVKSEEEIPTNLLADRLKRLIQIGVVRRVPYQRRPLRYEYRLTARGADLLPVLLELSHWSHRHIPGRFRAPRKLMEQAEEVAREARASG